MSDQFEPRLIGFLCRWCSYNGADLAGTSRLKYPANMVPIKTNCSGRVDPTHILKAFNQRLATLEVEGLDDQGLRDAYAAALTIAYDGLAGIEARDARLFKVFRQDALTGSPGRAFVPLDSITR